MANGTIQISGKIKDIEINASICNISPSISSTHISFGRSHSVPPSFVSCNSPNPSILVGANNLTKEGFDIRGYYTNVNTARIEWMAVWA